MAKSDNQKLKLMLLARLLERQTDEAHPMSAPQLIAALAEHGVKAERKSIYSDIAALQDFGMDICLQSGKSGGYYLASREFELPELKLLVDAAQASKFLSERKTVQLIRKLETLTSRWDAGRLRRQVVVSGRVKTMNESVFYTVDQIHEAIAANRQLQFRYFEWGVDKQKHFRDRRYVASPYALCWENENYYLIAYSERHGITHYRVDKMAQLQMLDAPRVVNDETRALDVSKYGKNIFGMFGGEQMQVKMRFENALAGVVLDRFGHDIMLIPDGDSHFTLTTDIAVSPVFFGWLAGFGSAAKIVFPQSAVDSYIELCKQILQQYG